MADFPIEAEERLRDKGEERLLLLAVVDDMLRHEIAFRETTVDKTSILVFPSQATLEHPEMPEPEGREMVFDFVGPVLNIYATLIVRLAYCGFFTITGVWKNAATYQTQVGGTYGIFLQNFGRGEGRLTLFFQRRKETNEEMCLHFETFVQGYLESRAKKESVKRRRIFRCTNIEPSTGTICNTEIHEYRVQTYRRRNRTSLICDECGQPVSLLDGQDRLSVVLTSGTVTQEMGREADAQRERERNAAVLEYKIANNLFDVFLCHNGKDKPAVMEIGKQLKEYGILPWLDQWELRPGLPWQRLLEQQIEKINSAAVFVGENGIGPWEQEELEAFLREFTRRGCPVIPVLLPNTRTEVKLPPFLSGRTWADFRKQVPDPLDQLYWGITGKHLTRRGPA